MCSFDLRTLVYGLTQYFKLKILRLTYVKGRLLCWNLRYVNWMNVSRSIKFFLQDDKIHAFLNDRKK